MLILSSVVLAHLSNILVLYGTVHALKTTEHQALIGTRCSARCLERHDDEFEQSSADQNIWDSSEIRLSKYKDCLTLGTLKCFQCINPCLRSFTSMNQCMMFCHDSLECMMSCVFLKEMSEHKMGYCPAASTISYTDYQENVGYGLVEYLRNTSAQMSCSNECQSDFQCKTNLKCCRSVCQNICRHPLNRKAWLPPPVATSDIRILENRYGLAMLRWRPGISTTAAKSVMFVVEEQYYLSKGIPKRWRNWNIVAQTSDTTMKLHHLRRGYWYRFRIAAVNLNGTKGFTVAQQPFRLSAKPRIPPPARNIEQVSIRIVRGMKLNLQLRWKLEKDVPNDLPIKGFHIRFSETSTSGHPIRHKTRHKFVRATHRIYSGGDTWWLTWVRNLRFYNHYNISIVTASGWKNYTLYSRRTYTSATYPHQAPTQNPRNVLIHPPFTIKNNTVQTNLTWQFTYSEAAMATVKFMVEWTVDFCLGEYPVSPFNQELVSKTAFLLVDLGLACRYFVSVQAMYGSLRHQWSTPVKIIIDTPPCVLQQEWLVTNLPGSCTFPKMENFGLEVLRIPVTVVETNSVNEVDKTTGKLTWEGNTDGFMNLLVDGYFVTYSSDKSAAKKWQLVEFNVTSTLNISPLVRNVTYTVELFQVSGKFACSASVTKFTTRI
uniref:anosmin-1 isoform X2 n=1 Tax=Ciona intestinalis TaxID=7719 RepID=UPI000EF4E35E|nr:anosmin-1 isoform X2 [Ciona intestinalis]|eukprot:XP_026690219.1 anosmin-1 isoform X2 [Ciona intestinalis]